MSQEKREWLATMVLVGNTDQRGHAWHYRMGDNNHFTGAIPVGTVRERLFGWTAEKRAVYMYAPTDDIGAADSFDDQGNPQIRIEIPNFVSVVRSDTNEVFGMPGPDYKIHDYNETLINASAALTDGNDLGISSAGLLKGGRQAWVELSLPESIHDPDTDFTFRPNLLSASSLDGSIATTFSRTVTATVCDNTLSAALGEKGLKFKVKHSKYSDIRVSEARAALSLIDETAEQFIEQLHSLSRINVTDADWFNFLDVFAPIPEDENATQRGITRISNKRDALTDMYNHDIRVEPWRTTALGVIQAVNTYSHHAAEVRGASRVERNAERAVSGKIDALDLNTLTALNQALAMSA